MRHLSNKEWVEKASKQKDFDEYTLLEEYQDSRRKMKVRHNVCGNEYYVTPRDFVRGLNRCPICLRNKFSETARTDKDVMYNKILDALDSTYEIIDLSFVKKDNGYNSYYVTLKHNKCGKIYRTRADHITSDHRMCSCTRKTKSLGEDLIKDYLNNNSIVYDSPKIYKDLKDEQPLHYDFYIPSCNLLIEYQGLQHYDREHQISGGKHGWDKQVKHDKMKRRYAKDKNIKLLEIPFTINSYSEIERVLNNHLNSK